MKKTIRTRDLGDTFVMKGRSNMSEEIVTTDRVLARHPEKMAKVGSIGPFDRVASTGQAIKGRLTLSAHGGEPTTPSTQTIDNTSAALKKVLRRVRPQELTEIVAAREEVEAASAALKQARARLNGAIKTAFDYGNVVPLSSLDIKETPHV